MVAKNAAKGTPLNKEFKAAHARIVALRGEGSKAWDELWELVGDVIDADPPLYLGGGYASLADYVRKELPGETVRSTQRNVLVARCFSPEDEKNHGISFLEEIALLVKERAGAKTTPPAIDLDRLTIEFGTGKNVVRKKARQATVLEVRKARRALKKDHGTAKGATPSEKKLRGALAKDKALTSIGVRATATHASFSAVPLDALPAFAKALSKLTFP